LFKKRQETKAIFQDKPIKALGFFIMLLAGVSTACFAAENAKLG
jgi:hypothetical protein